MVEDLVYFEYGKPATTDQTKRPERQVLPSLHRTIRDPQRQIKDFHVQARCDLGGGKPVIVGNAR